MGFRFFYKIMHWPKMRSKYSYIVSYLKPEEEAQEQRGRTFTM